MHLSKDLLQQHAPRLSEETVTVRWTDQDGQRQSAQVLVVEMTVADRTRFDQMVVEHAGESADSAEGIRQALAIICARTPDREPIWSPEDFETVSGYGSGFVEPIVNAAQRLNGVSDNDIEELAKNSSETTAAAS